MKCSGLIGILLIAAVFPIAGNSAEKGSKEKKDRAVKDIPLMMAAGPVSEDFRCSELLAFPTDSSVQIHLIPQQDMTLAVRYGTQADRLDQQTDSQNIHAGESHIVRLENLKPDAEYFYRLEWNGTEGAVHRFHTARAAGETFCFAVQADSHLDDNSDSAAYSATLQNIAQSQPDFLIDLGDSSMVEKLDDKSDAAITQRNLLMRNGYGKVAHSVPLFMAPGNHDGEKGSSVDGTAKNLTVRATRIRKQFYPVAPDTFYSSAAPNEKFCGTVRSYYAWTWGDALFVVIDPYRYPAPKAGRKSGGWDVTLGETQYRWLRETLEKSPAKYKFVFSHQLVGGSELGRGGVEYADWYEWGGHDPDGKYRFDENRPGWGKPIHQLLVAAGVTAFFHGHDHFYARQEKDGVIYQLVPQPASESGKSPGPAVEYGYVQGDVRGGSGFVRVSVSPAGFDIKFIQTESPRSGGKRK
ncbi:MAG: metallophosphoesterase [Kiritimatiellales bacterium]